MDSKTNWENIVSGQDLLDAKKLRNNPYKVAKERTIALPELIEEGWEKYKDYSDPKFVGVRRKKPFDEQFEDQVWSLFAKMGFTSLNKDRHFEMSYDFTNPNHTQQIDVFAADDETVLIIECKSSENIRECDFKKQIEALHGQMDGLAKEARTHFKKSKVKFIWATHNCILKKADLDRLKDWNIAYFNDSSIEYYKDLVKHLGSCAKYQLLGSLFANVEINNMDEKVPAIQGKMGGHTYYSFSIEPEKLLKIGYVLHRNEANKNMMPTYQRLIKKKRLQEVQKFIENKGYFPNSIVISIDTNGKPLRFDFSEKKLDGCISKLGILYLPKRYRSAYIIDGQHRLYGYSDSQYSKINTIPVVAFVDLEREEQIKLFMEINEKQKSVPKTLRVTLNSDLLWNSKDYNERQQAVRSKIAQMLGEESTSPLLNRVVTGENETTPNKNITIEALQQAIKRSDFLTIYGKKNTIVKDGTFDLGDNDATCDHLYTFLEETLKYVKNNAEAEWEKDDESNGVLTINRGIQAVIRVINDIINHLLDKGEIAPKKDAPEYLAKAVAYYLDPLIDFINGIDAAKRKELRGIFGGGADTKFWRTYQKVVADSRPGFAPAGMESYWIDENKAFNQDSIQYINEIQRAVKHILETELSKKYGKDWILKSIPKTIYQKVSGLVQERRYDLAQQSIEDTEISEWDFITLADCKAIALSGTNWSDMFDSLLTRPEDSKISGGKEAKTAWMMKIDSVDNKLKKSSYSVSSQDFDLIKSVYEWLCK